MKRPMAQHNETVQYIYDNGRSLFMVIYTLRNNPDYVGQWFSQSFVDPAESI